MKPEAVAQSQRFLGWHYADMVHQDTGRWTRTTRPQRVRWNSEGQQTNVGAFTISTAASSGSSASPAGFGSTIGLPTGYIPTAVVQGDFNEDGKTDLAFSNGGDNTIYVLLGNGDGTFKVPEVLYTLGQSPVWLATAKFRKSGHLDLAVVDGDSGQVELFSGNGDGTFQASTIVQTLTQIPTFVLAGDFDGDGNPDLAVGLVVDAGSIEPQFVVLVGDGKGSFPNVIRPPSIDNSGGGALPSNWLATGDLNNDGKPDIVVTVEFAGAAAYLNQNGSAFGPSSVFGPNDGAVTVGLGDMDGDGCLDAIEAGAYGLLTIAKGGCNGEFTQGDPVAGLGDVDVAIEIADVDGDGHLDVVASSAFSDAEVPSGSGGPGGVGAFGGYLVTVLKGDGKGGVSPAATYRVASQAYSLVVADLTGDNRPEVVTISQVENKASLLLNDGSGGFGKPSGETIGYTKGVTNNPLPSSKPQTVDLNGDGKPDVLVMEFGVNANDPSQITTLLNDGTGKLSAPIRTPISLGPNVPYPLFAAGNFRNSSVADLIYVTQYSSPSIVAFFPGTGGGSFGSPTTIATLPNPYQVVSGDFNGDHKLDVAVLGYTSTSSYTNWELDVFLGNGDGTFKQLTAQTFTALTSAFPEQLIAGDFNHDGKLDLLLGNNTNGGWVSSGDDIDLAVGNGDGTFQTPTTLIAHFGPVAVADLNHDGYPDLVQARDPDQNITDEALIAGGGPFIAPAITIYLGAPGGVFNKQHTYFAPGIQTPSYEPALVGDFNGDGDLDVALPYLRATIGVPWEHGLQVFQGVGDGNFLPMNIPYQLPAYDQPVVGGDYRGIGITDLLDVVGFTSSINTISSGPAPSLILIPASSPLIGNTGSATVVLALPATSTQTVTLSSSDPAVQLPASVTFNSGDTLKSFSFSLGSAYDKTHVLALYATLNGQSATGYVTKPNPHLTPGVIATLGSSLSGISTLGLIPGDSAQLMFTLHSVGGYSGVFGQFTCSGLPAGASCNFAQSTVELLPGGFAQVALSLTTLSSQSPGSYSVQVQASNGEIAPAAQLTFGIGDFSLSVSPSVIVVNGATTPAATVSAAYTNGFSGTVNLMCTGLPASATCTGPGVLYPANTSTTVSVAVTSPSTLAASDYAFQIVGTSGTASHAIPATLRVTNFSASLDKTTATVASGQPASFNVTLTSLNHFSNSNVSITCQSTANITCSTPTQYISLSDGATVSTPLSVTYHASTTAGIQYHSPAAWISIATCLLVLIRPLTIKLRLHGRRVLLLMAMTLITGIVACSGGSSGGGSTGGGGGSSPGSQTASIVVTAQAVTAAGNLQQNAGTITLTVTQ